MKPKRLILISFLLLAIAGPVRQGAGGEINIVMHGDDRLSEKSLSQINGIVHQEICGDFLRNSPVRNLLKVARGVDWYAQLKITKIEINPPDDAYVTVGLSPKATATLYYLKKEGENWRLKESY